MTAPSIVWFRQDLRLSDQAALAAAAAAGPVVAAYVLDDDTPGDRRIGAAQRWWLHHSLEALDASLRENGSRLILRRGKSDSELARLAEEVGATIVHAIRHWEPWQRNAERAVAKALDLVLHDGNQLARPGDVRTGSGGLYKIYTPFWRALCERMPPPEPVSAPREIPTPSRWPNSEALGDWELTPSKPDWASRFGEDWTPGEEGARRNVARFREQVADYEKRRNLPFEEGTSRLSPHLHFGEVSPGYVWHRVCGAKRDATKFLKELTWREYTTNVITQFPKYGREHGNAKFDKMRWRRSKRDLEAWRLGRTGYPIVDAGMRQLWATGWMHNRVRMIAASFLVKHLLIDWREGDRWFWDTLVDADYGNNSVNWQWIAGTGVDANMFVRIMAPLSQSAKFDAGDYIRRWVPEIAGLDDAVIHDPHEAGCAPADYSAKLIGHREARMRALAAYRAIA